MKRAFHNRAVSTITLALLLGLIQMAAFPQPAEAQVWKKIKKKAEEVVGSVRCLIGDSECIEKAKTEGKEVVLTDEDGKVLTDEKGEPVTDPAQLPPEQQAQAGQQKPAAQKSSAAQVPKITLPAEDRSWEKDPVVQQMKDHFLIGKNLWSAATDQLVSKDFAFAEKDMWLVAGHPDLLLSKGWYAPSWGFAHEFPFVQRAGNTSWPGAEKYTKPIGATMEMCLPSRACEDRYIQRRGRSPGPFLSDDFRRVIFIQEGDAWRADVDWSTYEIVNRQQVTQIGILGNPSIDQWPLPLHWYGNTLFLHADLSEERPILKIDLISGEVEELPAMGIFEAGLIANPSGYRLCNKQGDALTCYDLRTGKTEQVSLPGGIPARRGLFGDPEWSSSRVLPESDTPEGTYWIDDETLVSYYNGVMGGMGKAGIPAGIVRIDFRSGRADILFEGKFIDEDGRIPEGITRMVLLPGKRHVAIDLGNNTPHHRKVRIAVEDGAAVALPDVPPDGVWLDDDKFFYGKNSGGISEIGAWVHDAKTGAAAKICHVPALASIFPQETAAPVGPSALFFPDRAAVYFLSYGQGNHVFKADLSTGRCRKIAEGDSGQQFVLSRLRTPSVDLRPNISGDALWK